LCVFLCDLGCDLEWERAPEGPLEKKVLCYEIDLRIGANVCCLLQIPCLAVCVVVLGGVPSASYICVVVFYVVGYLCWRSGADRLFDYESI